MCGTFCSWRTSPPSLNSGFATTTALLLLSAFFPLRITFGVLYGVGPWRVRNSIHYKYLNRACIASGLNSGLSRS